MDPLELRKKKFIEYHDYVVQSTFLRMKDLTPIEQIMLLSITDLLDEIGRRNYSIKIQEKIGIYTVDFLLIYCPISNPSIEKKIIIECDGHDYHERTKEQAAHDKKRDRYFAKKGYTVLRYTGSEIVKSGSEVFEDVCEIIFEDDDPTDYNLDQGR
ncbi:endonuclease domain-containing protein [Paenibacillus provencensis]|uniref:Endonuclease domain-containing protein n=1 Tax=Paenibacillus provencensis TaxID=441151 RepID=A0ABW3PNS1_9BACL